jgi:hypothetical protein
MRKIRSPTQNHTIHHSPCPQIVIINKLSFIVDLLVAGEDERVEDEELEAEILLEEIYQE